MEKKTNRESKTIIISVIIGVIVLAGAVGFGLAVFKLGLFAKPFVEENDMTISNPNQTFSAPIEWFGTDSNLSIVNIPGMTSETATSTNNLYDYKIVEQNNDSVTISYKDAVEVTCKGSAPTNNIPQNLYSLNLLYSYFAPFDYYTGDMLYNNKCNISTLYIAIAEGMQILVSSTVYEMSLTAEWVSTCSFSIELCPYKSFCCTFTAVISAARSFALMIPQDLTSFICNCLIFSRLHSQSMHLTPNKEVTKT